MKLGLRVVSLIALMCVATISFAVTTTTYYCPKELAPPTKPRTKSSYVWYNGIIYPGTIESVIKTTRRLYFCGAWIYSPGVITCDYTFTKNEDYPYCTKNNQVWMYEAAPNLVVQGKWNKNNQCGVEYGGIKDTSTCPLLKAQS